ncbi:MAG: GH116 family glycosyl-hydrolase [Verrucomicrobia bacterium]|nr:GH116 family glycosyl-hydrolase [Verrucomicrobiota bacterium]
MCAKEAFAYRGAKTKVISFPLGGIGSGSIGLAGNGQLIDWEIFNKPNKFGLNGFSHFAARAESKGKVLDARVLQGDLLPPYIGTNVSHFAGSGFGPNRETLAGMPNFKETEFVGTYPIAQIRYEDRHFPGRIIQSAFNPFIPLNDKDSSIPAAFFEFEIENTTKETVDYTLAATLGDPLPAKRKHRFEKKDGVSRLHYSTDGAKKEDVAFGDLTLATDAKRVSVQQYWFRSGWFDSLEVYWQDFTKPGPLKNRDYADEPNVHNTGDQGMIAAHIKIKAGDKATLRFVVAWNFPNCENYWQKQNAIEAAQKAKISPVWKNYYATIWKNSVDSALYALKNWKRLNGETHLFRDTLFNSTLPKAAIDAVSANMSILKTSTCLRLTDGTFYGFEGGFCNSGCCEGTCTHVWNYAQALPFLFPKLERSVRDVDYKYNQQANGGMPFRIPLPLGIKNPGGRSCADGLFGNVMMVYRDWKICGDLTWLKQVWSAVKKSIEFAWDPDNVDQWDPKKTGVLWGRQHHTLDMELFGPSAWLCGFYLGALKAGAEMAAAVGDKKAAREFSSLFALGRQWVDEHLFNGEYYQQVIDLKAKQIPASFEADATYWNAEHGEIKYQIDEGCAIDQVLAQYHANLYGLGHLFDPVKTRTALKSMFQNNFRKSMREVYNPCRLYALNGESGLVICSWPEGRRKPAIPLTYAHEAMHGFEYAAAVQMIQNGLVKKGMAVVEGVRDRYDGEKRNPWNEFECGNNYARSMASYALLNAFSGFQFDMAKGVIGFTPAQPEKKMFSCFWSLDSAWGMVRIKKDSVVIRVLYGKLELKGLCGTLPDLAEVSVSGKAVTCTQDALGIAFVDKVLVKKGQDLVVKRPA